MTNSDQSWKVSDRMDVFKKAKKSIAIIDLGSNSIRMNIFKVNARGGYSVIEQASEMVRLSEGMNDGLTLKEKPIERTIQALHYFNKLMQVNEVNTTYALATAAVRMSTNQKSFLKRVKDETFIDFRVLTGQEEAYYDFLGVVNSMPHENALLMDIGGGSTELILMQNRTFAYAISLPIGSVTLTEKFSSIKSKQKRIDEASKSIQSLFDHIPWLDKAKGLPIIGLGGVIRTLGKIDRALNGYPLENMHHYRMHEQEVERICKMILNSDEKDLDKIPGLSKKRLDIITLGILPFKCLFDRIQSEQIFISGNGLREGYFYEALFQDSQLPSIVEDVLEHSVENMLKRFNVNIPHAQHVERLTLKLFDALKKTGNFTENDRKLIHTAALLHDIGMHIEYYDHHIHGFYLILYGRINGLSNQERMAVAYLVGSHREESIKSRMDHYESLLSKSEMQRLGRLVVLLNIAEQLDRSENASILDLQVKITDQKVEIETITTENVSLEIASAQKFMERFEKQFSLTLSIS